MNCYHPPCVSYARVVPGPFFPFSPLPKVDKLAQLFPSANVTKMVSRTPAILYLDIDRTVKPKAMWIKQAVGLEQEGLDRLVEQGKRRDAVDIVVQ